MLKLTLVAAAFAASATVAFAQDMRAQDYNGSNYGGNYGKYNDGGLGRYCPPGYYPHTWPTGNGIRCEAPDRAPIYNPAY